MCKEHCDSISLLLYEAIVVQQGGRIVSSDHPLADAVARKATDKTKHRITYGADSCKKLCKNMYL